MNTRKLDVVRQTPRGVRRGGIFAIVLAVIAASCGGDDGGVDAEGTYVHEEEGTIILDADGSATWTQSSDPISFDWQQDGEEITFTLVEDSSRSFVAHLDDEGLTLGPDAISGDDPQTFVRQD